MLNIKNKITNTGIAQEALKKRANDYGLDQSEAVQNLKTRKLLERPIGTPSFKREVNSPINSNNFREYLRDLRYYIHLSNLNFNKLDSDINTLIKSNANNLMMIRKETDALDSLTIEKEIQFYQEYDLVHYNSFSREVDMPLSLEDRRWLQDYKTETSFTDDYHCFVINSAGITLPIIEQVQIPFVDAILIGEETDVGDTSNPILSTDPRSVFLPDKTFRHVIIRSENDTTSRVYKRNNSYCTLQVSFSNLQLVNYLKIVHAAASSLSVESIVYVNESNEQIAITSSQIEGDTGWYFLFEPLRAKAFIVKFIQYAPVSKLKYNLDFSEAKELNKFLAGLNWEYRFDESAEDIEGRVFDFSIQEMSAGLNLYSGVGLFRSKDLNIDNLASVQISDFLELVPIVSTSNGYSVSNSTADVSAYTEYYLGLEIKNKNGTKILEDLIPIPDTYPIQAEYLPLIGGESRVKLFPDLLWNAVKNRILTAETISGSQMLLTTESNHGLAVGSNAHITGPYDNSLLGIKQVINVLDEKSFVVSVVETHSPVTKNTTPRMYLLDFNGSSPFNVFKDGVQLSLGTDYQINFGEVDYWRSTLPNADELSSILQDARSGKMRIKFLNPSYESSYWINYYPYDNQFLGQTKHVKLISGRAAIQSSLKHHSAKINTICILRSNILNPYITVVLRRYSLKVKKY